MVSGKKSFSLFWFCGCPHYHWPPFTPLSRTKELVCMILHHDKKHQSHLCHFMWQCLYCKINVCGDIAISHPLHSFSHSKTHFQSSRWMRWRLVSRPTHRKDNALSACSRSRALWWQWFGDGDWLVTLLGFYLFQSQSKHYLPQVTVVKQNSVCYFCAVVIDAKATILKPL